LAIADVVIPEKTLRTAAEWIARFQQEWQEEVPMRIHARGVDAGHGLGSPPFHPEFERYIDASFDSSKEERHDKKERGRADFSRNTPQAVRLKRAFRRLRKMAPREFDALYMVVALGHTDVSAANELTLRAIRLGHPERYSLLETRLLILSGLDKIQKWY
jgi:hypothetical protein